MPVRVETLLELLHQSPLVRKVRVVGYDETPSGTLEAKIRCHLAGGYQLQVWLHRDPSSVDYAYQVFTDQPLWRWDNAPHYPLIATALHHFHDEAGQVRSSPLSGAPIEDLQKVLAAIKEWLSPDKETIPD